jgi:tetratricopeptide (TPR) repeat protein
MQVGRYADAYALNEAAAAADAGYLEQCRTQGIYPLLYFPHNEHFKVWAAMFEGRSAVALADARHMAGHVPEQPAVFGLNEVFRQQPLYVLARFGRWDAVLAEPAPPASLRLMTALWHYARGLAHRFQGDRRAAERELKALRAIGADPALAEQYTAFAPTTRLIEIAGEILAGEIALARDRTDEGIARLGRAVQLQDGLLYNEPPDWFFPVRHYLGAALLDAGHAREAEQVYWEDLRRNRENGYALSGLAAALRAQGRDAESAEMTARFQKAFARADVTLTSSRY